MTKECWLFLDCEQVTGYPSQNCPNYKACRFNAIISPNRWCSLPYYYSTLESIPVLEVCYQRSPEALEAGWHHALRLPYQYEKGKLEVGAFLDRTTFELEDEARAGGYAIAEDLPYIVTNNPKQLQVSYKVYKNQKKGDWGNPVTLPYRRTIDPKLLEVDFERANPEYLEAIALGWHPAERIDFEDTPW